MATKGQYYWRLANDGRIWGCMEARWVGANEMVASRDGQPMLSNVANMQELYERIDFYGQDYGELETGAMKVARFEKGVTPLLDQWAGYRQYESIDRVLQMSNNPVFATDGEKAHQVYSNVWARAFVLEASVMDGSLSVEDALLDVQKLMVW